MEMVGALLLRAVARRGVHFIAQRCQKSSRCAPIPVSIDAADGDGALRPAPPSCP